MVALLAAGWLAIPATAQDAPTTCDFSQSHLHNGWGWNEDSEVSCAPAQIGDVAVSFAGPAGVEATQIDHSQVQPTTIDDVVADHPIPTSSSVPPLMVGTCDYSKSHHFDGYGWDETNGVSCEPLLTTSTTEYIAPPPGSPEDTCDYSKSHHFDGYGWDEVNGIHCAPMANRIAKAAARGETEQLAEQVAEQVAALDEEPESAEAEPAEVVEQEVEAVPQTRPPAGSSPVHPDDWDGDGVADPMDSFPFDRSRS